MLFYDLYHLPVIPFVLGQLNDAATLNDQKARKEIGYTGAFTYALYRSALSQPTSLIVFMADMRKGYERFWTK
jgi:hypothetical protein